MPPRPPPAVRVLEGSGEGPGVPGRAGRDSRRSPGLAWVCPSSQQAKVCAEGGGRGTPSGEARGRRRHGHVPPHRTCSRVLVAIYRQRPLRSRGRGLRASL